jgi:hypothetical protein
MSSYIDWLFCEHALICDALYIAQLVHMYTPPHHVIERKCSIELVSSSISFNRAPSVQSLP